MRVAGLRWVFLAVAVAGAIRCAAFGSTVPRTACAAVSGLAWLWMSRRKARSLDRDEIGLPPRR